MSDGYFREDTETQVRLSAAPDSVSVKGRVRIIRVGEGDWGWSPGNSSLGGRLEGRSWIDLAC